MMRLYSGCGTRRLTSTTIVFCILVDTTSPTFSFLKPCAACVSAILFPGSRHFPLPQDGIDAGPRLAHRAYVLQAVHLPHRHLKVKTKHLLVYFTQLIAQLGIVEIANFLRFHILLLR